MKSKCSAMMLKIPVVSVSSAVLDGIEMLSNTIGSGDGIVITDIDKLKEIGDQTKIKDIFKAINKVSKDYDGIVILTN